MQAVQATKKNNHFLSAAFFLSAVFFFAQQVHGAAPFQISGFFLGATPEDIGVEVDTGPFLDEKFYELEEEGVRLFFIQVDGNLRVYRIIKENDVQEESAIKSIIDDLKAKYGAPDKQQVKSVSIKSYSGGLSTSIKNKAIWNISDSQTFIAEIESKRVIYELVDNEPETVKPSAGYEFLDSEGSSGSWDPDY